MWWLWLCVGWDGGGSSVTGCIDGGGGGDAGGGGGSGSSVAVGEVAGEAAVVAWWWQWLFISDRHTIHVISDIFTVFFRFITSFKKWTKSKILFA
jgi:hypothetical protein